MNAANYNWQEVLQVAAASPRPLGEPHSCGCAAELWLACRTYRTSPATFSVTLTTSHDIHDFDYCTDFNLFSSHVGDQDVQMMNENEVVMNSKKKQVMAYPG